MSKAYVNIKKKLMRYLFHRDGGFSCAYCSRSLERNGKWRDRVTVDHIVPRALGGPLTDPTNFVTSCADCNNKKGDNIANIMPIVTKEEADFLIEKSVRFFEKKYRFPIDFN